MNCKNCGLTAEYAAEDFVVYGPYFSFWCDCGWSLEDEFMEPNYTDENCPVCGDSYHVVNDSGYSSYFRYWCDTCEWSFDESDALELEDKKSRGKVNTIE